MEETSVQALTKVIALMPPRLRRRMDALRSQSDSLVWGGGPVIDADVLTTLAQACRDDEPLTFGYTARAAERTERRVEPHRLVSIGRRWYLVAYDRDRQDWRSFRVDRVTDAATTGQRFRPRDLPAEDALAFVQAGIRSIPQRYAVRVRVATTVTAVQDVVGRWGEVSPDGDRALLEMSVDDLAWPVMVLARLDAEVEVESPPELRDLLVRTGERFARAG
jgi:predicted DNA-binding transcriptional regulator YafY